MTPSTGNGDSKNALLDRLQALTAAQRAALRRRMSAEKAGGHSLIAEALRRCGMKRVLGITGTPVHQVFPECAKRGIRPIGTRHQQASVLMAAAANYVAGRMESAVVVSAGPAVTNALTGVLVARDNGWPVLVMGGRRPIHQEGIGYFQELDAVPIFQSVTKWAAKVERTSEIVSAVVRAHEIASSGRPGPVYLDLPEDVLDGRSEATNLPAPAQPTHLPADAEKVTDAARLLLEARQPLLILGDGIRWSYCPKALRRLVERLGIPFIAAPMGRGFLSDDHPLCANEIRRWIQTQADVVLMAGACFDYRFRFGAELAPGARIIHVDIDPTMLGKSVAAALTICADSGLFLTQLDEALAAKCGENESVRLGPWREQMKAACEETRLARKAWLAKKSALMGPQHLFSALRDFLPADAVVVLDGSITLASGQALLSARTPCGWLDPGWNGCMGASIPLGMGAKLAAPERMVVVACGDFAFGLSAMELETAVRHRIPILVVVANNDGITGANRQKAYFLPDYPERFSQFLPQLRYERIMDTFGGHAEWVTEAANLRPALERAAASGLPACINVSVDPDAPHPGFW